MTREELIKEFDKQNFYETSYRSGEGYVDFEQVKSYIFDTMIKEVLKSLDFGNNPEQFHKEYNKIIKVKGIGTDDIYAYFTTKFRVEQLQKAKELYHINL